MQVITYYFTIWLKRINVKLPSNVFGLKHICLRMVCTSRVKVAFSTSFQKVWVTGCVISQFSQELYREKKDKKAKADCCASFEKEKINGYWRLLFEFIIFYCFNLSYLELNFMCRTYLKLPWKPLISVDGTTTYDLDEEFRVSKNGLIGIITKLFKIYLPGNVSVSFKYSCYFLSIDREACWELEYFCTWSNSSNIYS